jgi:hypothetical protein
MLYRSATVAIIAFWLVMMTLLVRLETHPEATDILDVPVSYVMRIMFRHGQQSFLSVSDGTKAIGSVALRPLTTGPGGRTLDFSGSLAVPQRFNFSGSVEMDASLRVRNFRLDAAVRNPRYALKAEGDAISHRLTYEVRADGQLRVSQSVPMSDAALSAALAQNLGMDPRALPISPAGISSPAITAREAEIVLRGEPLEVYQVTVTEGSVPLMTFYVTQLGQIIQAKTSFGYSLTAEDWE